MRRADAEMEGNPLLEEGRLLAEDRADRELVPRAACEPRLQRPQDEPDRRAEQPPDRRSETDRCRSSELPRERHAERPRENDYSTFRYWMKPAKLATLS